MRKLYLIAVLLITSLCSYSQFINLPDTNFRNALIPIYPTCFNAAKQLDTSCAKTNNTYSLSLVKKNINNVSGIEYFTRLTSIILDSNPIASINKLPLMCFSLSVNNCNLTVLNAFNNNLNYLSCYNNFITSIPNLPNNLYTLECSNNFISSIGVLPSSLTTLSCSYNKLVSLPNLNNKLINLVCTNNELTTLPLLPQSISIIDCSNNLITSLPRLDTLNNLNNLNVSNNLLTGLPSLPININFVRANNNQIAQFPNLNSTLLNRFSLNLYLQNNQITQLPNNLSLFTLNIAGNPIASLPIKLNIESMFICSYTNITSLPDSLIFHTKFTNTFKVLDCSNTKIRSLSDINLSNLQNVTYLKLNNTDFLHYNFIPKLKNLLQIELNSSSVNSIPAFPTTLKTLWAADCKNLFCLPRLNDSMHIIVDSSSVNCVFNKTNFNYFFNGRYTDSSMISYNHIFDSIAFIYKYWHLQFGMPTCNPTNNINNCPNNAIVQGKVFFDSNNNLTKEPNEFFAKNLLVVMNSNSKTFTNDTGYFALVADTLGVKTIAIFPQRFYTAIPNLVNVNFTKIDTTITLQHIALQLTTLKDSLSTKVTPINWAARPGFVYPYLV
ncbi:MAG: hypothetical protein ACOVO1_13760, partial [Chitinophagaceae bacterium]